MDALIIAGPRSGEVHNVPKHWRFLQLIDPGQMEPVGFIPNDVPYDPPAVTVTTWSTPDWAMARTLTSENT